MVHQKIVGTKEWGPCALQQKYHHHLAPVLSVVHGLQNTIHHECASHHPVRHVFYGAPAPWEIGSMTGLMGLGGRGLSDPRPPQMNFPAPQHVARGVDGWELERPVWVYGELGDAGQ